MTSFFSMTRALVARKRKIFALFFALAASIGMMNAKVTWNSSNISDLQIWGTNASYSKEGVTLRTNADQIYAEWQDYGDESQSGISFNTNETGGYTFSNTLGKNFTKIEMTLRGPGGWDMVNLGSGWSIDGEPWEVMKAIWTGNASTVDLAKDASDLHGDYVRSIVFYFVGDSEAPDPTYTIALQGGTANADKVTLSATSAVEGATVTVTPNEEYEITAFKATYNTTEELSTSFNTETEAYSFKMPAYDVTIEATITLKPVPEGDVFAGFTATAGSGGFNNEGHANLVDNKFTSADWTKWCADNSYKSVPTGESGDACWWIDFEASAALNLTGYILTTGNDTGNEHGRNPKNWVLKAKLNADDAWTTIATVTNDVTMKNKSFKDYKFFVDQSGSYKYFRFEVFANQGASVMQLCELRLIGTEAAAPANPSGTCGDNLTWEFDPATGALTISGTGTMLDEPSWMHEDLNSRITSVSLPEGLTYIRDYVFANCENLESITLPSGLTSIESSAFMNCRALREITLPGSLTTLGERAFYNCAQLESIILPEGITTLGNEVFAHCNHLQSVTLPPSLTTLGDDVFRECGRLESITLPDGLTSIGNNAFSGCHYLESITIPEGVTSIGSSAFEYCGFESIKLPDGITTLENSVFSGCDRLQSVTLPSSLTSIGEWAFSGCWNLASVTLPESVTTIGESAFGYCTSLTEFTNKAATPQTINANVFEEVTLSNITLNVPESSKAAYEAADVWKDFGTKATLPAAITKTITDNGMTYDIYDNGVVKVSGTGIVAARIFAANDHDYVPSVKRFEFADDCKVYSFGEDWYMYYTSYSPLEAVDIKTTLPFVAGRESVFYRKEYGSDESVTVTITAPAIASINNREFVANYGTPQHIIFNTPVTTFEKSWCSYLSEIDTVTIPTGSLYHLPASYAFKDEYKQYRYDDMVAEGYEDMFWKYEASGLVEGVDYTPTEEKTGVITAENDSVVFGKAVVKYQAPQEAPATSWTFWRSDDFMTFPELENGSSHTCKDVTLKIVDGSFNKGSNITLSTSATNGIQLIAPKGKIFKQVIALDRDLRTSFIWTGEADTVGISSNLMQISLIEFELDAAPASVTLPEAVAGLVYNGEAQTLIAAGEAAGFTFQYKVGENGEYSADLPTATDAGSYTVYYKATAEGKEDITGSVEVSIAKAALTITAENKEVVYGLAAPGFSVSYSGLQGSDLPADVLTGELSYACDYTVGSNAGEYDITPSGQTSANYDITFVKGKLVVYKADPAFTAPTANTLTYNGGAQTLIAAGTTEQGTFEYTFTPNDEESWNTALPQAKNADTYGVYYRVVGDANHNDYESADAVVVTIAKAALTATADNKSVIYGDDAPEYTVTYEGWQGEDNADVLSGTIAYACEYAQTSNVGDYTIVPSGVSNPDYAITFVNGKVTVSKAALTITADDKSVIYGDEAPAFTASYEGFKNEDDETVVSGLTLTSEYVLTSNVGEYDIVPANATATNYAITFVNGTLTVNKAALTITAENKEVVYGYAAPGFSVSYYGLKGSDLPADVLTGELSYACDYTVGSNVASYDIVPSGQTSANYDITYVKGTLVVYKADPAFTAPTANTLTYNGGAQTLIAAGTTEQGTFEYTFTPNDEESWNTALPQAKNADTYGVYYRIAGDANHNDYESADAVVVTIAKAALTATADDKSVIYGDDAPEYTVTYEGWQGEDNADVLSGTIAYACEYAQTSNVGDYTITPSGVSNPNYAITFVNGKVTVSKAALTITADDKSVIYGDEAPAFTASYEGFKNEDDETVVSGLTLTSEYVLTSNVGEYDIVPANATAQNYAITFVNGTLTVNKAALMITADDKEVTYGDEAPAFTASYEGFKNEDDETVVSGLTLTSEYVLTSNVGEYDIVPADATAQNYAISYTKGTLTVNQAALMITADDKEVIYGDEAPAFTASYEGFKNEDDETVVSGLTLTSEYVLTSNVGEYDIVPADAEAQNYAISYTNGTLTVNQAALTITAEDKVMIYGDEHPEFTVTYEGFKNEDDESVVSGLKFSTPYAPGSYIGTYAINPNSATALNYAITFVDGTLTVNKAHVYVSDAEAQIAKFADGHANAVVLEQGVLNGIKLNDPIAHVTTAAFSSADVAENLTITLFYELTGDAALLNNYNLDPTSDIFTTEGVIIEPFIPDNEEKPEDEEATVDEGIEIYAYGYCDGSGYSLKYHLESGNPDQYKIDFEDSRFTDVDWTNLVITGKDGTIDIDIPVDLPTGDYTMTVYFRDSRFDWLESRQFNVTFHVNLPETYVRPLFDNVIALVDTCHCLTDIQWYWRANSSEPWQPIEGANGYYYHADGKLTGEYFVSAKMNGEPTYTCGQADMETLYGAGQQAQAPVVRAYPNPVVNTTIVTIENSDNFEHNLRVVNLMGAEVMSTTFEGNETNVEMSGYPQGNYMISVDGIVVKVMKQ